MVQYLFAQHAPLTISIRDGKEAVEEQVSRCREFLAQETLDPDMLSRTINMQKLLHKMLDRGMLNPYMLEAGVPSPRRSRWPKNVPQKGLQTAALTLCRPKLCMPPPETY